MSEECSAYQTGYYGRASIYGKQIGRTSCVHIVGPKGPICGYKPHPTMSFQFCAGYINISYVECVKCKRLNAKRIIEKKNTFDFKTGRIRPMNKNDNMLRIEEEKKQRTRFKRRLEEKYNVQKGKKADKLFELAWNFGHSYGENEVEIYYSDMVELIKL